MKLLTVVEEIRVTIIDTGDDDDTYDELFLSTKEGCMLVLTVCRMQLEAGVLYLPRIPQLHHPAVVIYTTGTALRQEKWKEGHN